ncbi:MAG: LLM class flavin-dependent oxidoreductase [Bifidobacteriaceae bacterium]|jgi:alkanesulfonate monooxygenase SsuD/methylene tetrahydromethanopterin reductase-like flavin-dependent oxidoreductase (luciferase family)|nr:LLM class flavin-dependent oxidoreductase [Bifidobacteriaceae bacterium]
MTLTSHATHTKRAFLGTELVDAVDRFPCPIEDDQDFVGTRIDLGTLVRLARTAKRGAIDYLIVDDTLAGNPPFSGRRRDALEAMHLAVKLAPAAQGVRIAPRVHSGWVEPIRLLSSLVGLELAAAGRTAWQLDMPDHTQSRTRGPEMLAAIVEDVWSADKPKTGLAAIARAHRARRIREGNCVRHRWAPDDAGPLLLIRASSSEAVRVGAQHADVIRISAANPEQAKQQRSRILAAAEHEGRNPDAVFVAVDLAICLNSVEANAAERADLIESITSRPLGGEGARYVGTPAGLAETMVQWLEGGSCDGFTFLPASLPIDLVLAVDRAIPELRSQGWAEQ